MDWDRTLQSEYHTLCYSEHTKQRRDGIAFIARKDVTKTMHNAVSDRVTSIRLCGQPFNLKVVQVHAPITDAAKKKEADKFYGQAQSGINKRARKMCCLCLESGILQVRNIKAKNVIGLYGIGNRNEATE